MGDIPSSLLLVCSPPTGLLLADTHEQLRVIGVGLFVRLKGLGECRFFLAAKVLKRSFFFGVEEDLPLCSVCLVYWRDCEFGGIS